MGKKSNITSVETESDAQQLAKANQRPGQTKEQTRLVAQGIAKGIAEYKKQHKAKMRVLDKKRKQASARSPEEQPENMGEADVSSGNCHKVLITLCIVGWLLLSVCVGWLFQLGAFSRLL